MPPLQADGGDDDDEDDDDVQEDSRYVFHSAPELFDNMRKTMMKAASFSIHQTMADVFVTFKNVITFYVRNLSARIRRIKAQGTTLSSDDIKVACAIIGTLEYVDFTLPQLCDSYKGYIDESFHAQIDFDSEQEAIGTLTSFIYSDVLVKSCEEALAEPIG